MQVTYQKAEILRRAHVLHRQHKARVAAVVARGDVHYGKPQTFADFLRMAWRAAKQEAFQLSRGFNVGLTELVEIAAPASELRRAA